MEDHPCKDTPTSIMNLPEDCLILIFERLRTVMDRESFGLTCHRWLKIQNSKRRSLQFHCSLSSLYLTTLSKDNPKIDALHLYRLLNRFQHLSLLSLSGCTELPDAGLSQLQHFGSNLHTLYLDCCFGVTDIGISLVASGSPSLVNISLYRCNIGDISLETLANWCSSLQNVNLSHCTLISDIGIKYLMGKCRQLRAVTISYCRNITGHGFKGCPPTLSYIEADSCKLEPEGILGVVSGGGLEYLNLSSPSWCILGDGLSGIGEGLATRLRVLNLRMFRSANDKAIMAIAKGCPLLQEWSLAVCQEVRLSGWEAIGSHCHNLEILHVNRCRNLCDRGLQALRDGCSRLLVLHIHRCSQVSDLALEEFKMLRGNVVIKQQELVCIDRWSIFPR